MNIEQMEIKLNLRGRKQATHNPYHIIELSTNSMGKKSDFQREKKKEHQKAHQMQPQGTRITNKQAMNAKINQWCFITTEILSSNQQPRKANRM